MQLKMTDASKMAVEQNSRRFKMAVLKQTNKPIRCMYASQQSFWITGISVAVIIFVISGKFVQARKV